jgi:hypothetical protein
MHKAENTLKCKECAAEGQTVKVAPAACPERSRRVPPASGLNVGTAALGCPVERSSTLLPQIPNSGFFLSIGKNYTIPSIPLILLQI